MNLLQYVFIEILDVAACDALIYSGACFGRRAVLAILSVLGCYLGRCSREICGRNDSRFPIPSDFRVFKVVHNFPLHRPTLAR